MRENRTQTREILLQLDRLKTEKAVAQAAAGAGLARSRAWASCSPSSSRPTTGTSHERYEFFYRELAPLLELYRVQLGDILTIKAFTRSGYVQSVNVHVYGTFQFQGLEKSTLAGSLNLMDLMSFRELYGYLTADKKAEIEAHQARRRGRRRSTARTPRRSCSALGRPPTSWPRPPRA